MASKKQPAIPAELAQSFRWALNTTWQAIGYDIIEANGGKAVPRKHMIECVLDCDYVQTYGQMKPQELAAWKALSYEQRQKVAKDAFSFKSYGM